MSIIQDYKKFINAESKKRFSFKPDSMVRNSSEFTEALCQYAEENNLNLNIIKEGMYPTFELDGTAYIPEKRKRIFRFLHGPYLLFMVMFLIMAVSRQSIVWTFLVAAMLFPYLYWMFSGFRPNSEK